MASAIKRRAKVEVGPAMQKWKVKYVQDLNKHTGNPRDVLMFVRTPDASHKACTHNFYFKQLDLPNWWQLPQYLRAGLDLGTNAVRNMARFRLSSHNLRVERGRYQGVPWLARVCERCAAARTEGRMMVDDEHHLVFECITTRDLREGTFAHLFEGFDLENPSLRQWLNNADWKAVVKFVHQGLKRVDSLV